MLIIYISKKYLMIGIYLLKTTQHDNLPNQYRNILYGTFLPKSIEQLYSLAPNTGQGQYIYCMASIYPGQYRIYDIPHLFTKIKGTLWNLFTQINIVHLLYAGFLHKFKIIFQTKYFKFQPYTVNSD